MTGHKSEENPGNPGPLLPRPLIRRHKTLARVLLYSAPLVLVLAGYGLVRLADAARTLQLAWTEVDYSKIESVRLFQEYLRYDTTYPDGNEIEAAEFLARVLRSEGIPVRVERLGERNANLEALIEGRDPRRLVLHSHIDTEPVLRPKLWRVDPFGGALEPPFIYGRGAFDMKSVTIAQLAAMLDLKRSGKTPEHSVQLLATSDEERDSWLGTRRLLKLHPEWPEEIWAVLTEGGAVEAVAVDEVKYWGTEYHQKRFVDIWVCDASRRRLKDLRRTLHNRSLPWRLEPSIAEFLPYYGPSRDRKETRRLLASPESMIERLRTYPEDVGPTVLPPYVEAMLRTSISAFPVEKDPEGGYRVRIILHLLPSVEIDEIWDPLIGDELDGFTYLVEEVHPPVGPSDLDHEVFQGIDRLMEEKLPDVDHGPLFIPYSATDARYFRQYGVPVYGFSPFLILSADAMKMRGVNERMPAPAFVDGVELYTDLVRRLVGVED